MRCQYHSGQKDISSKCTHAHGHTHARTSTDPEYCLRRTGTDPDHKYTAVLHSKHPLPDEASLPAMLCVQRVLECRCVVCSQASAVEFLNIIQLLNVNNFVVTVRQGVQLLFTTIEHY